MPITHRAYCDAAMMQLDGVFADGNRKEFSMAVAALTQSGCRHLIINLQEVAYSGQLCHRPLCPDFSTVRGRTPTGQARVSAGGREENSGNGRYRQDDSGVSTQGSGHDGPCGIGHKPSLPTIDQQRRA